MCRQVKCIPCLNQTEKENVFVYENWETEFEYVFLVLLDYMAYHLGNRIHKWNSGYQICVNRL